MRVGSAAHAECATPSSAPRRRAHRFARPGPSPAAILVVSWALPLAGCDITRPDARYVDAPEPVLTSLDAWSIPEGRHLAGRWDLQPPAGYPVGELRDAAVFVDGTPVRNAAFDPPTLLDTAAYPEGPHEIALALYERNPDIGLLGAAGAPSVTGVANVIFDQTPPAAVAITSVVWEGNQPRITWTPSPDANFYAYNLVTSANRNPTRSSATILDRDQTTFLDTPPPLDRWGLRLQYRLAVSNNAVQVASSFVSLWYGDVADLDPRVDPVIDPAGTECYALGYRDVQSEAVAYPAASGGTLRRNTVPLSPDIVRWSIDPSGTRIYVVEKGSFLQALDTQSLSIALKVQEAASMYDVAAGPNDRVYASTYTGSVLVLDGTDGSVLETIATGLSDALIAVAADDAALFAAGRTVIRRVDPASGAVTHEVPASDLVRMMLSPDDTRLYTVHNTPPGSYRLEVRNAADLSWVGSFTAPDFIFALAVTPSYVYVSHGVSEQVSPYFLAGDVVRIDPATLSPLSTQGFIHVPTHIAVTADDSVLFAASVFNFLRIPWS